LLVLTLMLVLVLVLVREPVPEQSEGREPALRHIPENGYRSGAPWVR